MINYCQSCYFGLRTAYKNGIYCGKDLKSYIHDDSLICPDYINKDDLPF